MLGPGFEATIGAARRGDDVAIAALYRDTAPLVLGYLRSQHAPDPEDIASETFVAMVRGIDRFEGDETGFRSWLLTIAHRRMLDVVRRRGRRPEEATTHEDLAVVASPVSTERAALARHELDAVLAAVDGLTDDQRAVLLLRVVADLPIERVAEVLDKPVTAVKALQRRAFAALQRALPRTEAR